MIWRAFPYVPPGLQFTSLNCILKIVLSKKYNFYDSFMINNKNLNLNCKQLTNGDLKRVESLSTEDFIRSAKSSPEVKIDQSTVTAIEPCNERGTVMITFSVGKDNVKVGYTGT